MDNCCTDTDLLPAPELDDGFHHLHQVGEDSRQPPPEHLQQRLQAGLAPGHRLGQVIQLGPQVIQSFRSIRTPTEF